LLRCEAIARPPRAGVFLDAHFDVRPRRAPA